jgi:Ala-tRNA(Pro) deacylase
VDQAAMERRVLALLDSLGIPYTRIEHPPVYTVDQARAHWRDLDGAHCKNLFLRNKKGKRHFLVILEETKSADLKALTRFLEEDRLSFASPERLKRYLGLEPGAVSPFGLMNDTRGEVEVLVDQDLMGAAQIYFHPNVNTATVGLSFADFERFLEYSGHRIRYFPA